jgi:hypothetical protein
MPMSILHDLATPRFPDLDMVFFLASALTLSPLSLTELSTLTLSSGGFSAASFRQLEIRLEDALERGMRSVLDSSSEIDDVDMFHKNI